MLSYYALVAIFLVLTAMLIKKMKGNPFIFVAAVLPLAGLFWDRFDIFPAFFSLLALYLLTKKRINASFFVLSLGVLTKIYPIVFLPILVVRALLDFGLKKTLLAALFFILPIAIIIGNIVSYGGGDGLKSFVEFQGKRGTHLESVRATPSLIKHLRGEIELETVYEHNTFEIKEVE